jgi:hypothetical protein
MQVGDVFQGLKVVKLDAFGDGKYIQLEYPAGHPQRAYRDAEEERYAREMAESEAGTWVPEYERQTKPHEPNRWNNGFTIPSPTKTGLPARNDTIGRFIAGLSGGTSTFSSDGRAITSYGGHWKMVRATMLDDDGNVAEAVFRSRMWETPYSSQTAGHMQAIRNDPRLWSIITNRDDFPDELIDRAAYRIAAKVIELRTVEVVRRAVYNVVGRETPDEVLREGFKRAKVELVRKLADDRKAARSGASRSHLKQKYTKESIAAYLAWHDNAQTTFAGLLDEYEKRFFKGYDEKMPPIPTRKKGFARPELIAKPYTKPKPKKRDKGVLAWHFLDRNRKLRFGDGRVVDVGTVVDVLLEERGMEIALCDYGLHGSRRMRDAYSYFRGSYLTRTLHYGHIEEGGDKLASQYRECIGMIDVRSPIGREIMELIASNRSAEAEKKALAAMGLTATQRTVSDKGIVGNGEVPVIPIEYIG